MKRGKKDTTRLKQILTAAYWEKEKAEVGDRWQERVMGTIREMAPVRPGSGFFDVFGQALWRFAPVACGLLLLLGGCILKFHLLPGDEMARMVMDDPVGYTVLESLALLV